MKRAAIYSRVSTKDQSDNGTSLLTQTAINKRYAADHDFKVVTAVAEDVSGRTLNRAGLEEIRQLAARGEIDALIFHSLDRLSRNDTNTLVLARELRDAGVALECATVKLEDTPSGRFLLSILAAVNELEVATIMERSRRGKVQRAKEGRVLVSSFVPYGYRYVRGEGRLEPDPVEAPWVPRIFEWVGCEGRTTHAVARLLTEAGAPTKHRTAGWRDNVVSRIVRNETYKGRWVYGKNGPSPIDVPVPALVDDATWQKANAALQRNRDLSPRNTRYDYLLRGLLKCGNGHGCLGGYSVKNSQGHQYFYYRCPLREPARSLWSADRCTLPLRPVAATDNAVWGAVVGMLAGAAGKADVAVAELAPATEVYDAEALVAETALKKVTAQQSALIDMHLEGDIDRTEYRKRTDALRKREALLRHQLREVEEARQAEVDSASHRQEVVEAVATLGSAPTFEQRRAFLLAAATHVTVHKTHMEVRTAFGTRIVKP